MENICWKPCISSVEIRKLITNWKRYFYNLKFLETWYVYMWTHRNVDMQNSFWIFWYENDMSVWILSETAFSFLNKTFASLVARLDYTRSLEAIKKILLLGAIWAHREKTECFWVPRERVDSARLQQQNCPRMERSSVTSRNEHNNFQITISQLYYLVGAHAAIVN